MSIIKANTWQNPDGTENYKCRAWVNFNGTGTVAIRASGNVSSITDNGTGDYTVNFTNAMPDANYCSVATSGNLDAAATSSGESATFRATTSVRVYTSNPSGSALIDRAEVNVAIFR
jgi:uncharacterized protein (AIM24 family)